MKKGLLVVFRARSSCSEGQKEAEQSYELRTRR